MAAQSDDIRVLRFSTDDLPERDRLPIMREVHGRLSARVDIEPAPGAPLHYSVTARALPGLIVSLLSVSPHTVRRTRALLADGMMTSCLRFRQAPQRWCHTEVASFRNSPVTLSCCRAQTSSALMC